MSDKAPAVRLREAPADTRVRLHYFSARNGEKTKTGVKEDSGGPLDAAVIDTQTEFHDGSKRLLRVKNGGKVMTEGPTETQSIGLLTDVGLPEDADEASKITLEDADEVDWLAEGRDRDGEEA